MGTDYTTGVLSEVIDKDLDASDQVAFIEKGFQLFSYLQAQQRIIIVHLIHSKR